MKKMLIALAMVSLSATAFAQSSACQQQLSLRAILLRSSVLLLTLSGATGSYLFMPWMLAITSLVQTRACLRLQCGVVQ